jgi:hypothetical protein
MPECTYRQAADAPLLFAQRQALLVSHTHFFSVAYANTDRLVRVRLAMGEYDANGLFDVGEFSSLDSDSDDDERGSGSDYDYGLPGDDDERGSGSDDDDGLSGDGSPASVDDVDAAMRDLQIPSGAQANPQRQAVPGVGNNGSQAGGSGQAECERRTPQELCEEIKWLKRRVAEQDEELGELQHDLNPANGARSRNARFKRLRPDIEHRMWSFFTRISALMARYYKQQAAPRQPVFFRYNGQMYKTAKDQRAAGQAGHNRGVYSRKQRPVTAQEENAQLAQSLAQYMEHPYSASFGAAVRAQVPAGLFDFDYRASPGQHQNRLNAQQAILSRSCKDYTPQAECLQYDHQKFCQAEAKLAAFFGTPAVKIANPVPGPALIARPFQAPTGRLNPIDSCLNDADIEDGGKVRLVRQLRHEERGARKNRSWPTLERESIDPFRYIRRHHEDRQQVEYTGAYLARRNSMKRPANAAQNPVAIAFAVEDGSGNPAVGGGGRRKAASGGKRAVANLAKSRRTRSRARNGVANRPVHARAPAARTTVRGGATGRQSLQARALSRRRTSGRAQTYADAGTRKVKQPARSSRRKVQQRHSRDQTGSHAHGYADRRAHEARTRRSADQARRPLKKK